MARSNAKGGAKPRGTGGSGALPGFLAGLGMGLLCALAIFLYYYRPAPASTPAVAASPATGAGAQGSSAQNSKAALPQPTFDFYKILPNREVNLSEWVAEDKDTKAAPAEDPGGLYILQVGSFKTVEAADQVKAKLALLGITADVQRVVINGQDVRHRVRIGPYHNPEKFEEVRQRLLSNDMDFMVLKLKIEEGQGNDG